MLFLVPINCLTCDTCIKIRYYWSHVITIFFILDNELSPIQSLSTPRFKPKRNHPTCINACSFRRVGITPYLNKLSYTIIYYVATITSFSLLTKQKPSKIPSRDSESFHQPNNTNKRTNPHHLSAIRVSADMEPPRVISRQEETGMEVHPAVTEEDPCSSLWDFGDLLDFTIDGHFSLSLDTDQLPSPPSPPPLPPTITMTTTEVLEFSQEDQDQDQDPSPGKIRKRDPRLTCTNYLAGRIPCACPEMDEKLEMEGSLRGKKRPRTVRASSRTARCQVPECEADISELKGYHRRHRVCLRCANATAVLLDGETKRYCQQCGK